MANTVAAAAAALGAPLRLRVLQAYLHVRRASKNLFTGDDRAQYMAWERTKNEFLKHKDLREPSKVCHPPFSIVVLVLLLFVLLIALPPSSDAQL